MVARTWRDDVAEMNEGIKVEDSDGDKLEIVNGAVKVSQGTLQADSSELNPTGDSVQARDYIDGDIISGLTDPSITFNEGATTNQDIATITYASVVNPTKEYLLTVQNTSVVTGVTVTVQNVEPNFNGATAYPILTSIEIPAQSTRDVLLRGLLVGKDAHFYVTPDAAMSDTDAANRKITMRLRKY